MAWHGLLSFDLAWLAWLNCACHPVLASTNMADSWLDDDDDEDDDSCLLLFPCTSTGLSVAHVVVCTFMHGACMSG